MKDKQSFGVRNLDRKIMKEINETRRDLYSNIENLPNDTLTEVKRHKGDGFEVLLVKATNNSDELEENQKDIFYVIVESPLGQKIRSIGDDPNAIRWVIREQTELFRKIPTMEGTPFEEFYVPADYKHGLPPTYQGNSKVILTSQQKKDMQKFIELGEEIASFFNSLLT